MELREQLLAVEEADQEEKRRMLSATLEDLMAAQDQLKKIGVSLVVVGRGERDGCGVYARVIWWQGQ